MTGKNNQTDDIHRKIRQHFLDVLHDHRMSQVLTDSTHVLGNILDLICTSQHNTLSDIEIITPRLSDHSIIVADLRHSTTSPTKQPRTFKLYRSADQEAFQKDV